MSGSSFFSVDLSRPGLVAVEEYATTRAGQEAQSIGRQVYKALDGQREIVLLTNDDKIHLSKIIRIVMEAHNVSASDIMDIDVRFSSQNQIKKVSFAIAGKVGSFKLAPIERIKDLFNGASFLDQLRAEGSKTIFHLMGVSEASPIVLPFLDPANRAARKSLKAELRQAEESRAQTQERMARVQRTFEMSEDQSLNEGDMADLQNIFEETTAELETADKEVTRLQDEIRKHSFPIAPDVEGPLRIALEEKKEDDYKL